MQLWMRTPPCLVGLPDLLVPQSTDKPVADLAQLMRTMAMSMQGLDAETRLALLSVPDPKNAGYYLEYEED